MDTARTLYISRICLHNIRCFSEDVVLDLTQPSAEKPSWTLILGDNGTGKTSLMRCIAMCLCDETSASGLLRELKGEVIRQGCSEAFIEVHFHSESEPSAELRVKTSLLSTTPGTEEIHQETTPNKGFPWSRIFACGYGAARSTIGNENYEKYRLIDSTYSLFNYDTRLQNPETAIYRMSREGIDVDEVLKLLDDILMLPPKSTLLDSSGLQVSGPWGTFIASGALGDGYTATIGWITDLLGWSLLALKGEFSLDVRGIVLIDEIEQHLHPSWQSAIVRLLSSKLPSIQFVSTTHAPLVAIGSAALTDECCQLVLLQRNATGVRSRSKLAPPRTQRADQVLTSYLFGLQSTTSDETTLGVSRYAHLCAQTELTAQERSEREELRARLKVTLGGAESQLQETVRKAVHETLTRMASDAVTSGRSTKLALDYEVRRQLREIFGSSEGAP